MYQAIDARTYPSEVTAHLHGSPLTIAAKMYGDSKWIRIIAEKGETQQQLDIFVPNLEVAHRLDDVLHEIIKSYKLAAGEATDIDDVNKDEIVDIDD